MGTPAALVPTTNGGGAARYGPDVRAEAIFLRSQGLTLYAVKDKLLEKYGTAPHIDTLCDWTKSIDFQSIIQNSAQELSIRYAALHHKLADRLTDIAEKPDLLKHGFLINASYGTNIDKTLAMPAATVHADTALVQVFLSLPKEERERLASRGTLEGTARVVDET